MVRQRLAGSCYKDAESFKGIFKDQDVEAKIKKIKKKNWKMEISGSSCRFGRPIDGCAGAKRCPEKSQES